jgi:hypothetical protein
MVKPLRETHTWHPSKHKLSPGAPLLPPRQTDGFGPSRPACTIVLVKSETDLKELPNTDCNLRRLCSRQTSFSGDAKEPKQRLSRAQPRPQMPQNSATQRSQPCGTKRDSTTGNTVLCHHGVTRNTTVSDTTGFFEIVIIMGSGHALPPVQEKRNDLVPPRSHEIVGLVQ